MRLTGLEIESFKKIRLVAFKLKGGITEISGPNGAGKSSAIDSIDVLIDGLTVAPPKPIRTGATQARIRGDFGELIVTRTIERTKKGTHTTSITFERPPDGKPYPATQRQLSDLIGEHNLDPLDFVQLDTKGKWNALRAFVPGFDFEKCANAQAADFARRTDVNRIAKEARAAANLIVVPEGTPEEPIDEAGLVAELAAAGEHNTDLERRRANREKATETVRHARAIAAGTDAAIEEARARVCAQRDTEVGRLQEQIRALERQVVEVQEGYARALEAESTRLRMESTRATEEADALEQRLKEAGELPAPIDTAALRQRIENARLANQAVTRGQERSRHLATAAKYEAESEQLTAAMAARERTKREAISQAKLPIPGIDFGEGEILYNGEPLEQASTAEKLRVAIARIVALNSTLKLAWIRDASLLDDASYSALGKLAEEFGVDVLIETVRPIGKDAVILEDGTLKESKDAAA